MPKRRAGFNSFKPHGRCKQQGVAVKCTVNNVGYLSQKETGRNSAWGDFLCIGRQTKTQVLEEYIILMKSTFCFEYVL